MQYAAQRRHGGVPPALLVLIEHVFDAIRRGPWDARETDERAKSGKLTGMGRFWRWLWRPRSVPEGGLHETWTCPECGRRVEVVAGSLAAKRAGWWWPPHPDELRVLCRRQHGTGHREGGAGEGACERS